MTDYAISASNLAKFIKIGYTSPHLKVQKSYVKECYGGIDKYMNYITVRNMPDIVNERAREAKEAEEKDTKEFEKIHNVKVTDRNTKLYRTKLFSIENNNYYLFGRIDGIAEIDNNKTLIEIKRCLRKYIGLKPWGKVQIECLMKLTGLNKSIVFQTALEVKMNKTLYYNHDEHYWTKLINMMKKRLVELNFETNINTDEDEDEDEDDPFGLLK